ncbi:MAG: hypothetical protein WBV73_28765 [Phormidium sp.]
MSILPEIIANFSDINIVKTEAQQALSLFGVVYVATRIERANLQAIADRSPRTTNRHY